MNILANQHDAHKVAIDAWVTHYNQRGWVAFPLPFQSKKPGPDGWQNLALGAYLAFDAPCNIAISLGKPSADLIDVDLDCGETVALASAFLTPTLTFGRPSKPSSHWLYTCPDVKTQKFTDPVTGGMLVEIRSTGAYTVFPGSVHETGEAITFDNWGAAPLAIDPTDVVKYLAATALLARYWPRGKGSGRHEYALWVAGGMARDGLALDMARYIIGSAARVAGDDEIDDRLRTVDSTYKRVADDEHVAGWIALGRSVDVRVISSVRKWLGLHSGAIRLVKGQLHVAVNQAIDALATADDIYQRDGELVRIVKVEGFEVDKLKMAEGSKRVRPMAAATLAKELCRVARWETFDGRSKDWRTADPSDAVVQAVMREGSYPRELRPLVGIVTTPSLRPDGSVICKPGYDEATGYVYEPDAEYPALDGEMMRVDAIAALRELADLFVDFPFRSDADKHVIVAAIVTLVCRPAIEGNIPAIIPDAAHRGSGKTLLVDIVSLIGCGQIAYKLSFPAGDEELEKRLCAYARLGARIVVFDNVVRAVEGGSLEMFLTAKGRVALRVLKESRIEELDWRGVILLSGNQIKIAGDMVRRVLVSRLTPSNQKWYDREPEKMTYPDRKDKLDLYVRKHRAELVGHAITLLAAYIRAGKPDVGVRAKGFEEWSIVAKAIKWAGGEDITECWGDDDADDDETDVLGLLIAWWQHTFPNGATAKHACDALARGIIDNEAVRNLRELLTAKCNGEVTPSSLGIYLRHVRDVTIDGRYLDRLSRSHGTILWGVRAR